jgi:hypothetical protein
MTTAEIIHQSRYRCSEEEFYIVLQEHLQTSIQAFLSYKKEIKAIENTSENDDKKYPEKYQDMIIRSKINIYQCELNIKVHNYEITKDNETLKLIEKYNHNYNKNKSTKIIMIYNRTKIKIIIFLFFYR